MTVNDTFKFQGGEQVIVHQLTEREEQDFGEKQAELYGFGSVKQWRTVMMIETNLGYKFNGSNYWELKDFISKYFESTKQKGTLDEERY